MMRLGREELRRHDRREPDRPCADDRDGVARLHPAVQDADLERRRQDVGEEEHVLVGQPFRHLVDGRVGERHARELGLEPVDRVAEDPAAAAGAEAVVALLAEPAAPARGDARDEDAGRPGSTVVTADADLDDRADRLVAEDRARLSPRARRPSRMCRSVPQIVAESMRTIASVGSTGCTGSGTSSQARLPGPWYTRAFIAPPFVQAARRPPVTSTRCASSTSRVA